MGSSIEREDSLVDDAVSLMEEHFYASFGQKLFHLEGLVGITVTINAVVPRSNLVFLFLSFLVSQYIFCQQFQSRIEPISGKLQNQLGQNTNSDSFHLPTTETPN